MHSMSDQEKIFMRKIEEGAGKQIALWVRRMRENYFDVLEEREDRARATLPHRQLMRLEEEHRRTLEVVWGVKRLLEQDPVPMDELRHLVKEALRTPPADPGEVPPFPAGSPR